MIVAIAAMMLFRRWFEAHLAALPEQAIDSEMRRLIGLSCAGLSLCVLLFAGYAAQRGRRVVESALAAAGRAHDSRRSRAHRPRRTCDRQDAQFAAVALLIVAIGMCLISAHLFDVL